MPLTFGITAFTKAIAESDSLAWARFLDSACKSGARHVQFLTPEREVTAKMFARIAHDLGIGASSLSCTFYPVCPCAKSTDALDAAKKAIEFGRIIAGDEGPNLVCSPSMLRGLCDSMHGLPGQVDSQRQQEFITQVAQHARTIKGTMIGIEPLNRFESRGPNTIAEVVQFIAKTETGDVMGVLADTCHQAMEERPVANTWVHHAQSIVAIHASALQRGLLPDSDDLIRDALQCATSNGNLSIRPIIIEAFCGDTDPSFFGPLSLHNPVGMSAEELCQRNLRYLQAITSSAN